ncbi:hypothetical protein ACTXT7_006043 [Hymenolepis weldensis]
MKVKDDPVFSKLLFILILCENTSVSRPRSHIHLQSYLTRILPQVTHKLSLYFHWDTQADMLVIHLHLRYPLIVFVPYLSLTRLNPHYGLINTFWPKQLLAFCSRTGVDCQPSIIILAPTKVFKTKGLNTWSAEILISKPKFSNITVNLLSKFRIKSYAPPVQTVFLV